MKINKKSINQSPSPQNTFECAYSRCLSRVAYHREPYQQSYLLLFQTVSHTTSDDRTEQDKQDKIEKEVGLNTV